MRQRVALLQAAIILGVLAAWELVARLGLVDSAVLSPASAVLADAARQVMDPAVLSEFGVTFANTMIAFAIAAASGIAIGLLAGTRQSLRDFSEPFIFTVYALPKVAVFPLFLLWFGLGTENKIAFAAFHGFFPVVINTLAGVRQTRGRWTTVARSLGTGQWQFYVKIMIPAMAPLLFTGLRIGLSLTLLGEVLAELFVVSRGVGSLIDQAASLLRVTDFLAYVVLVGVMATVVNQTFIAFERRVSRWRTAE